MSREGNDREHTVVVGRKQVVPPSAAGNDPATARSRMAARRCEAHGANDPPRVADHANRVGHLRDMALATGVNETFVVNGTCHHDCPDSCGWQVTVTDGTAVKLRGNKDHPYTQGELCPKVEPVLDRVYQPRHILSAGSPPDRGSAS